MKAIVKNLTNDILLIPDIGIELQPNESHDLVDFALIDLFASKQLFEKITAGAVEIITGQAVIRNAEQARQFFAPTYLIDSNLIPAKTTNPLLADEASLISVFKQTIRNNYTPLMLLNSESYIWGGCSGLRELLHTTDITVINSGLSVELAKFQIAASLSCRVNDWQALGTNAVISENQGLEIMHLSGKPTDIFMLRSAVSADWTKYSHIKLALESAGKEKICLYINDNLIPNSLFDLMPGHQNIILDITSLPRKSIKSVAIGILPYWAEPGYPFVTKLINLNLLRDVTYKANGVFEHKTKKTDKELKQIYYHSCCYLPPKTQFIPRVSFDFGVTWIVLMPEQTNRWVNMVDLVANPQRVQSITLGGELISSPAGLTSPNLLGYFMFYRYQ